MKLVYCSVDSAELVDTSKGDINVDVHSPSQSALQSPLQAIPSISYIPTPCVATMGNFDGIHIGHQALIKMVKDSAKQLNLPSLLISFEPLPKEFFLKEQSSKRLLNFQQKFKILEELDIDILCILRFNKEMSSLLAKDFIHRILNQRLKVRKLIIGEDFRFGKDRQGDITLLKTEGNPLGIEIQVAPLVSLEGQKVGSSVIRQWLAEGNNKMAEKALGRSLQ